jgi:integrase
LVEEGWSSIEFWINRLAESTRRVAKFHISKWLNWMKENGEDLADLTPDELVKIQQNARGNGEQFKILDKAQTYVNQQTGTYNYKRNMYSFIKSFFMHNRAELPRDRSFNLRGNKPENKGDLTPEETRKVILSCNPVYQAVFLCMLQGGMGQDELVYWNEHGWEKLRKDLKGDPELIRVDLPGRKKKKFESPYYAFIGGDAVAALKNWLQHRPQDSSYIFTDQMGNPVRKDALRRYWLRHLRKVGVVGAKKKGSHEGHRTGKSPHELRDVFRSQWEKTLAKASVAEYMMGHQTDPLEYNKAHRDEKWVRSEYLKALPMLQIMSSPKPYGHIEADEIKSLRAENADLVARLEVLERQWEAIRPETRKGVENYLEIVERLRPFGLVTEVKKEEE